MQSTSNNSNNNDEQMKMLKNVADDMKKFVQMKIIPNVQKWILDPDRKFWNGQRSVDSDSGSSSSTQSPSSSSFSIISNFESQITQLQSLLIWEKPKKTLLALVLFTCFYWSVVLWEPRLLSIVATLGFCYHFYEMWTRYVWPEIRVPTLEVNENWTEVNPRVLSAPEIKRYFQWMRTKLIDLMERLWQFRRRSHGAFCCYSLLFFLTFYYVGYIIPGALITYLTAMILFLTPGFLVYVMPENNSFTTNNTKTIFDVFFQRDRILEENAAAANNNHQISSTSTMIHSPQHEINNDDDKELENVVDDDDVYSTAVTKTINHNEVEDDKKHDTRIESTLNTSSTSTLINKNLDDNNTTNSNNTSTSSRISESNFHENHFSRADSSSSSKSGSIDSDLDFVMISDTDLIDM